VMDIAVQWGVLRYLRREVNANAFVLVVAIMLDVVVLAALLIIKAATDMMVIYASLAGMLIIFTGERLFLRGKRQAPR